MPFRIDRRSSLSMPAQVNEQTIAQVVAGRLSVGDRLPSVRRLSRDLHISRTTAERIHETLCEAMLAEMRPRSGAYVALQAPTDPQRGSKWAQDVYGFLKDTLARADVLGLGPTRLLQLIAALQRDENQAVETRGPCVSFPLIATRDWYECITSSLSHQLPVRLVHLPLDGERFELPPRTRYLLAGYYMHERALKLANTLGCSLLYLRYNAKLLDRAMRIGCSEHRYFLTRDPDNAESTRLFLASAYPDVSTSRYSVMATEHWRKLPETQDATGEVWATITVAGSLRGVVPPARLHILHPLLAEDFVDELRCLALLA